MMIFKNIIVFILFLLFCNSYAQNKFLYPLQKGNSKVILKPGNNLNPISNEPLFNNGYFISATYGTPVFAVDDGIISAVTKFVICSPDLKWLSMSNTIQGFKNQSIKYGKNKKWFREENVMGMVSIKLKDGTNIHYLGLISNDTTLITGIKIKKGDIIGRVGYFRVISKEPCIQITLSTIKGAVADIGIPLFGVNNHFEKLIKNGSQKLIFTSLELKDAFKIFRESLEEGHPALYFNTSKTEFDSIFSSIEKKINNPMSLQKFNSLLMPIVAKIGCSHTYLSYLIPPKLKYYFPLWLSFVEGRCIVIDSKDGKNIIPKGSEIIAIDNKPIKEIINAMKIFMFNDVQTDEWKEQQLLKPNWFQNYFICANNDEIKSSYMFKIITPNKQVKEITLNSYTETTYPKNPIIPKIIKEQEDELKFSRINNDIAYLSIQTCDFYDNLKIEIELIVDSIIKEDKKNLIVDLRYNKGGSDISFLSKLFINKYFDNIEYKMVKRNDKYSFFKYSLNYSENDILFQEYNKIVGKEGYWKIILNDSTDTIRNKQYFKGKIYVLTGAGEQSYGTVLATLLYKAGAIIVGEETGGNYYSVNAESFAQVKLGITDIVLNLPLTRVIFNSTIDSQIPYNRGLIPNYKISKTINSILKDEDNQLDYCIQLISKN
ncbi:MAG: hypothetical protein COX07_04910 [Bacteroidetes bacterium CG23_combo_of_CG06-09_8_20_14_all_32_9]|nr:MAG: hypothetical protein COX07_04910 [Bacteroidetes bacterium CG23_combo_of_CG06-09_8_20_14_all_32_9]